MHISSGASDGSSSLLPPKEPLTEHPDVTFPEQVKIPTITIDDWRKRYHIPKVDFTWLDVQGHELPVLKVAPNTLKRIQTIYTEVSLKEMYEGGSLYRQLRQWLENHGFRVETEELP